VGVADLPDPDLLNAPLLLIAYLTVFPPLGVRTFPRDVADRQSLECAQMRRCRAIASAP
jgi:hypothetical protein